MKLKIILFISIICLALIATVSATDIDNTTNSSTEITEDNYYNYFNDNGTLKVEVNDTLCLSRNFTNKTFIINVPLNITGNNSTLYDCEIIIKKTNNCTISNLTIINNVNEKSAILITESVNITIINNDIYSSGFSAYPIALNSTSNSYIIGNRVKTGIGKGGAWQHPGIFLGNSIYNQITSNEIIVEDSNGIYLSSYGTKESHYNIIANNTIKSSIENPSSWAYGIQMMGNYNTAINNTVIGMFRGISSSGSYNSIINNLIINLTGGYYQGLDLSKLTGGDYAIFGYNHTLIANNTIKNCRIANAGIFVANGDSVLNNIIEITTNKTGIEIGESDVLVNNNSINYKNGEAIYARGKMNNITILNNFMEGLGCGILIKYQSSKKQPTNVIIINNTVITSNNVAIDIAGILKNSYVINNNEVNSKEIILPEDKNSTSEDKNITSNTYKITSNNFNNFFNSEGTLVSTIKNNDILIFEGTIINKGKLTINKEIIIIGENTKFINTTIAIKASNVIIKNINIKTEGLTNNYGIFLNEVENITITGCNININDKSRAYGIYMLDTSSNNITNNTILVNGDDLTFGILAYETYLTNINFNKIIAIGTNNLHLYQSEMKIDESLTLGECSKTYGILLAYSSNNKIYSNNIKATSKISKVYKEFTETDNTIVGLDIYFESHNNIADKNTISIESNDPFLYGMGVVGSIIDKTYTKSENNSFINNNINVKGNYFATGFICGNNALNTVFENNTINVYANKTTYGATFEKSQSNTVINNKITSNAMENYVIEFYSSNDNIIENNNLKSDSKITNGISFYDSSNNKITNNYFNIKSDSNYNFKNSNEGHADVIDLVDALIYFADGSNNNYVANNKYTSNTKYIIKEKGSNGNIAENNNAINTDTSSDTKTPTNSGSVENNVKSQSTSSQDTLTMTSQEKLNSTSENIASSTDVGNLVSGKSKKAYALEEPGDSIVKKSSTININALIVIILVVMFGYGFIKRREN